MKRKQLTLFLEETEATPIEAIRQQFNPIQYALIKSHITLCREDELEAWSRIQYQLQHMEKFEFELQTNGLKRFSEGKGLLIAVKDKEKKFHDLRAFLLKNGNLTPRAHKAHITLMHPRNSTCTDEKFVAIQKIGLPDRLSIKKISLIEQEIGKEWRILKEYNLKKKGER